MKNMKAIIFVLITVIFLVSFTMTNSSSTNSSSDKINRLPSGSPVNLIVATDLHYLSSSLVEEGPEFSNMYLNSDGKQTNYITQITDAFIDEVITQKPDGLILSGDLTFNGEKKSHEELAQKLKKIQDNGIPVYVIPGNHDIKNYNAIGFKKDSAYSVENISANEFQDIYGQFGPEQAIYQDQDSLSYVSAVSKDLWLVMLDSNRYEHNNSMIKSDPSGAIRQGSVEWLKMVLAEAKRKGITPITVMHHNLFNQNELFQENFTIENSRQVTDLLNTFNVKLNLSGHMHVQHIANEQSQNNNLYDVATSSLSVFPNQYGMISFLPKEEISYNTKSVDMEKWAKENGIQNEDLLHFKDYSYQFFYDSSYNKTKRDLIMDEVPKAEMDLMANTVAEFNQHYFPGTVNSVQEKLLNSEGYQLWQTMGDHFMRSYLDSVLLSPVKDENHLTVELK